MLNDISSPTGNSPPPVDSTSRTVAPVRDMLVPKYEMRFHGADRLGQFDGELTFFSLAMPYLYGWFDDQPLAQFMSEYRSSVRLMYKRFDRPIFRGMGDDWNHTLWAVDTVHWGPFESYILSLTLVDAASRQIFRFGSQDVRIADPLFIDRRGSILPAEVPLFDIVVIGVDSSAFASAVECDAAYPFNTYQAGGPALKFHPPQRKTVAFAAAYFGGSNPIIAAATTEREQV